MIFYPPYELFSALSTLDAKRAIFEHASHIVFYRTYSSPNYGSKIKHYKKQNIFKDIGHYLAQTTS